MCSKWYARFTSAGMVKWEYGFIFLAYVVTFTSRFIVTHALGIADNHFHRRHACTVQIEIKDYFVMAFGGLRGAIAFALAFTLYRHNNVMYGVFPSPGNQTDILKYACYAGDGEHGLASPAQPIVLFRFGELFLQTTLVLVIITVFVQGTMTPYVLRWLKTRREEEVVTTHLEMMTNLMVPHLNKVHRLRHRFWAPLF